MTTHKHSAVDIAIFGGGIAGLWIFNRLQQLGFNTVLLESHTLGGGQTICSQGIIHGGIKYALKGFLTPSTQSIGNMPKRWEQCLEGKGEIDLKTVKKLSLEQFLWSTGSLSSELTTFFASIALNSKVQSLKPNAYPELLQHSAFKGHVFRLNEVVLDIPSLIHALSSPYKNNIFKIDNESGFDLIQNKDDPETISAIKIRCGEEVLDLQAQCYLFTGGAGNQNLAALLPRVPAMQRRPLHMVYVQFNDPQYSLFGHCMDGGTNPKITITTHTTLQGKTVWYLGGDLAEKGIHNSQETQIQIAQQELKTLFPWVDFKNTTWHSFFIDRAEAKQPDGKRPDSISTHVIGNAMIAWPTKLALAPLLSDEILTFLKKQSITPSHPENLGSKFKNWPSPTIATPIWET